MNETVKFENDTVDVAKERISEAEVDQELGLLFRHAWYWDGVCQILCVSD
jgi:hypothetical protein